jgi:hypothetical protein
MNDTGAIDQFGLNRLERHLAPALLILRSKDLAHTSKI